MDATYRTAERRLLQAAVALACLVPLAMGAAGVARGPDVLHGVAAVSTDLDSHFRYLSGLLFATGLAFASCIPAIERRGTRFGLLGLIVVAGGLGRLLSLAAVGLPGRGHVFGLVMELGVVPLLMLWQRRIARAA
ncbi:MAG: hypothetical protein QOC65_1292 [Sphingomonadales bacterium]|nr:hypothetical protein [Sphingomonadales bacterium]